MIRLKKSPSGWEVHSHPDGDRLSETITLKSAILKAIDIHLFLVQTIGKTTVGRFAVIVEIPETDRFISTPS